MANCHKCKIYLYDTIPLCVKKEIGLYDDYRQEHIYKILPELVDWVQKVCNSIKYFDFCECWANGRMFARRGKSKEEDELLLNLSIYYQMKRFSPLLKDDLHHIHMLLNDSGVLRMKKSRLFDEMPEKYLGLILPKLYLDLHGLHDDHLHPERHRKKVDAIQEDEDLYA